MQVKDSDEMAHSVTPMITHHSLEAGFSLARLSSGCFIICQRRVLNAPQERVSYGFAVERPAARIDHQSDQEELNNSPE